MSVARASSFNEPATFGVNSTLQLPTLNFSAASRTLNVTYAASAIPTGSITFNLQLLPNEQQILPSFVQVLRDRRILSGSAGATFVGALFVTDATGDLRGVSVGARTSTPGGGFLLDGDVLAYMSGRLLVVSSSIPGSRPVELVDEQVVTARR